MPNFQNNPPREIKIDGNGRRQARVHAAKGSEDFKKELQQGHRAEVAKREENIAPERIVVKQCGICMHPFRNWIEAMLIKGMAYKTIADRVSPQVDRRSVSLHYKKHMDLQDAALRIIIEDEARLQGIDYENGIQDAITKRGVLEVMVRKGFEDVLSGTTTVEPRDLIQIAKLLAEMDQHQHAVGLEEYRNQVAIFIRAIRAVCDPETQDAISREVAKLRKGEGVSAEIERALDDPKPELDEDEEVIVEAEIVEEPEDV